MCVTVSLEAVVFSGNVVTMECVEKIIKKDMVDPTNGKKLTEKDIIVLQRVRMPACMGTGVLIGLGRP